MLVLAVEFRAVNTKFNCSAVRLNYTGIIVQKYTTMNVDTSMSMLNTRYLQLTTRNKSLDL